MRIKLQLQQWCLAETAARTGCRLCLRLHSHLHQLSPCRPLGHWHHGTGHWLQNAGYRTLATGQWLQDTGYRTLATCHWLHDTSIQDGGSRTLVTKRGATVCRLQDTGYRTLATGHWLQDTGYRTLATGQRLQDTAYRTPTGL